MIGLFVNLKDQVDEDLDTYEVISEPYLVNNFNGHPMTFIVIANTQTREIREIKLNQLNKIQADYL